MAGFCSTSNANTGIITLNHYPLQPAALPHPHLRRVVNDHCLGQVPPERRQVLHVVPLHINTRVPEQPVVDALPLRVDDVQQLLRVHALAGREDDHLKQLGDSLEEGGEEGALAHEHRVRLVVEEHREGEVEDVALFHDGVDERFCSARGEGGETKDELSESNERHMKRSCRIDNLIADCRGKASPSY